MVLKDTLYSLKVSQMQGTFFIIEYVSLKLPEPHTRQFESMFWDFFAFETRWLSLERISRVLREDADDDADMEDLYQLDFLTKKMGGTDILSRKPIGPDVQKRLWIESMGRCMNPDCQKTCFRKPVISSKKHTSILITKMRTTHLTI